MADEVGICRCCEKKVKLIYLDPLKKGRLVIGPHYPSLDSCKLEDIRNKNCSGYREAPKQPEPEYETTAQK